MLLFFAEMNFFEGRFLHSPHEFAGGMYFFEGKLDGKLQLVFPADSEQLAKKTLYSGKELLNQQKANKQTDKQ